MPDVRRGHPPSSASAGILVSVKVREVLKLLESEGWLVVRTRGSHRQLKHPQRTGLVTVAGHPNDDLAPGTLNSIRKQAGLKP
jgi:predicted RNA binding protein YcfA (HicA-like mRNA interferase family)